MLYILEKDYFKIIKHCMELLPYEACGLAGGIKHGDDIFIQKIYLLTNTEASTNHFTMDIKEQFAAVKDMRKNGMQMAGNFHSHPSAPALLSEEDKRLAYDFNTSYMVLSLMDASFPVLKAYKIGQEKNVTEEIINIINNQDYINKRKLDNFNSHITGIIEVAGEFKKISTKIPGNV